MANPSAKLQGVFDFGIITRVQKKLPDKNISANNKSTAFNTSTNITAIIENQVDEFKYGASIVFLTTTAPKKSPSFNGSHIFIESDDFGKVELGAPFDAATKMNIGAGDAAYGPGGDSWTSILNKNPNDAYGFDVNVNDFYLSGFTSKNFGAVDREPSRKISYYTPKINGFSFGVSWIPDSTNGGADVKSESSSYSDRVVQYMADDGSLQKYNIRLGVKNAFAFGTSYEAQLAEATSLKLAVTGQIGKAIQEAYIKSSQKAEDGWVIDPNINPDATSKTKQTLTGKYKVKNLRSYGIGARLDHGNFSYSVGYGNLCKSFTSEQEDSGNRRTDFYGATAAYKQGPIGVSLTYLGGNNKGNKFDSIALGSEYTLAPGLLSYAEVAYAKGKGKGKVYNKAEVLEESTFDEKDQKFRGTSFILGLKVKF
jgi:hypothetical protein